VHDVALLATVLDQKSWEDKLREAHQLARRREEELSRIGITLNSSEDKAAVAARAKEVTTLFKTSPSAYHSHSPSHSRSHSSWPNPRQTHATYTQPPLPAHVLSSQHS
jgi:hypothetical protein